MQCFGGQNWNNYKQKMLFDNCYHCFYDKWNILTVEGNCGNHIGRHIWEQSFWMISLIWVNIHLAICDMRKNIFLSLIVARKSDKLVFVESECKRNTDRHPEIGLEKFDYWMLLTDVVCIHISISTQMNSFSPWEIWILFEKYDLQPWFTDQYLLIFLWCRLQMTATGLYWW